MPEHHVLHLLAECCCLLFLDLIKSCVCLQSRHRDLFHAVVFQDRMLLFLLQPAAPQRALTRLFLASSSSPSGIMQQFAISEATLFGWNSMDGESMGAGSNQGSVAHLSEVNQESITSRGTTATPLWTSTRC